ncbi:tyrosine-type recombinase/integrase [Halobaculum magnesiiphilum]|uniref:Tyrosine-type recombinase/integrase n=1 Tax=Halobaculum magnesiiphilum TaxID=1017351 RepID=A0A8T8WFI3_9EURY|nr:tyrosine-type recombinase/integrase [Halobaculum magnesiiphilum]QZP38546.1 tyrosine-type recombinase/integrase [Halobaculum magnesiiphilum]
MDPLIEDYLSDVEASKAYGTYENRKSDLRIYHDWLDKHDLEVTEVGSRDIHRFLREQGKKFSNSTAASRHDSVKLLYDFLAGVWDMVEESPFEDLKRSNYTKSTGGKKHQTDDIVYVTPDDKEAMAEHVPTPTLRNELILRLLYQTGVRRGELAIIEIDNIDREARSIRVYAPKTDEWRIVYYQPSLDFLLTQWMDSGYRSAYKPAEESPYLFVSERAERLSDHAINQIVKKAAENAGIQDVMYTDGGGQKRHRITAHAFRHGHAVQAIKNDIDIRRLQLHLGHEKIDTTQQYLQFKNEEVQAAMKKFNPSPEGPETA